MAPRHVEPTHFDSHFASADKPTLTQLWKLLAIQRIMTYSVSVQGAEEWSL